MARYDFNTAPYFDDFDPSKNYMKVLFRSGTPVQARELNTIQSTFQNQVEKFANHIFKNGAKVSNGVCSLAAKSYVRLRPYVSGTSTLINVEQFIEGTALTGTVSGVTAVLVKAVNATGPEGSPNADPATLYVVYTGTGVDGERSTFIPGETINVLDSNGLTVYTVDVRCPSCVGSSETDVTPPIGTGMIFTVGEGIFYFEGMFLQNARQDLIVHKYLVKDPSSPSSNKMSDDTIAPDPLKIGFDLVQTVVTFQEDASLLDPSLGYPNSTAPGAHRYKAELKLAKRSYQSEDGENFILLCKVGDRLNIEYMKTDSEYSEIMDMIAKRSYETNGNYTIRPFKVSFFESKKTGPTDARGWSTDGDLDKLIALVSPSVGYVKGYRIEKTGVTPISFNKARDTKSVTGFIKQFPERMYIVLEPTSTQIWPNDSTNPGTMGLRQLSLRNAASTVIGSCYVNDMKLHAPAVVGGPAPHDTQYRYYIYGLSMTGSNKLKDVATAITSTGFAADAVVDAVTGTFDVYNANQSALVYPINRNDIKSLRDIDDPTAGSITITVRKKLSGTLDGSESIVFNATPNQAFLPASNRTVIWVTDGGTTRVIDPSASGVFVTDGTSLTVTCAAAGINASKPVTLLVDMLLTSQKEKQKQLASDYLDSSVNPSMLAGSSITLDRVDVTKIVSVLWRKINDGSFSENITSEYDLQTGTTDYSYGSSKIVRNSTNSRVMTSNDFLTINYEYYDRIGSQGYFTIDSYPVDALVNPVNYEDLPDIVLSNKQKIKTSSAFDFRPDIADDATTSTAVAVTLPAGESTAIFNIEYYLGRTDLLQLSKEGDLYIKQGIPSETPRPPMPDENSMALYEILLKPYTYSLNDCTTKFIENKRYTMRDIGRLEKRIEHVEYYTALSLLEKSAADMSIKDENGLDRFKNGFVADNFSDFQAADLESNEFRAGVDPRYKELRPQFKSRNKKLTVDLTTSTNVRWHGNVGMFDYELVTIEGNPYATKHLSINPYYQYNKRGELALSPNVDVWSDDTLLPPIVVNADSSAANDGLSETTKPSTALGSLWGSWSNQNGTVMRRRLFDNATEARNAGASVTTPAVDQRINNTGSKPSSIAPPQTKPPVRPGTTTTVDSRTESYTIEDNVKGVQIIPYMRTIDVEFYASKLKANTKVYAFFDGVPVSEFCRDINVNITSENPSDKVKVQFGSDLITDNNGELIGVFRIPAGRFFVGEKQFKLSDDPSGNSDPDVESTSCDTTFFAGGLDISRQDITLNVITPTFNTTVVTVNPPDAPAPPRENPDNTQLDACRQQAENQGYWSRPCLCARWPATHCGDPVAQAFITPGETFVTGLDIFFKQFDPLNDKFFVEIRTMVNGYPSSMVLGRKDYTVAEVTKLAELDRGPGAPIVSDDSSVPMKVVFDVPIYLEGNTQYCFVVGGYSPNTRIWISHLGQEVVNIPGKIVETPPTDQVSFRSLNGTTWNAEQFEAIKYNLYVAKFNTGTMTVAFNLADKDKVNVWSLEENPFEVESGQNLVRVFAKDHGFTENDSVRLSLFDQNTLIFEPPTGQSVHLYPPQIGQVLASSYDTSSAVITDIKDGTTSGTYELTVSDTQGDFKMALNTDTKLDVVAEAGSRKVRDKSIPGARGSKIDLDLGWTMNSTPGRISRVAGSIGTPGSAFLVDKIANIPVSELNKTHLIHAVDSQDSFIILVTTPANYTGRVGGSSVKAYAFNEKYDVFNVSGACITYQSEDSWNLHGINYARLGSPFYGTDGDPSDVKNFVLGQDTFLAKPQKIESADPDSLRVVGTFVSSNTNTSPIVNADTFSVITISNRTEWIDEDDFNIEPNSSNRFVAEDSATQPIGGTETYKYVTKDILLADPANDLRIFFDVYRDINSDFDVYVKRMTAYGPASMDAIPWMKVTGLTKNRYSFDLTDRIEYDISASEDIEDWLDSNGDPTPFSGFKIKLVGRSKNSSKPVLFRSLRAIAVT